MVEGCDLSAYGRQTIEDDDVAAVAAALRGALLTTGPAVDEFESAFARRVGSRYAVGCSNGTAALHLALLAAEVGDGIAVTVPSVTFLACANAARMAGAEVVFADVAPDTGLLDVRDLAEARPRQQGRSNRDIPPVKILMPVHLAGQTVDMDAVARRAGQDGLVVIEDACHAVGATYSDGDGRAFAVGSCAHSDMAVFSFHPVKTITSGEGGMVTTNDPSLYERLRRLRNHGIARDPARFVHSDLAFDTASRPNPWYYEMAEIGYNYRITDLQCALGLSQLAKLDRFVARRRALADRYDSRLAALAPYARPLGRNPDCRPAWHLYVVLIDFEAIGKDRAVVMSELRDRGVGTQVHYIPVHLQPYYAGRYGAIALPGASEYYRRTLTLPLFPAMTEQDVDRVVAALAGVIGAGAG